MRALASLDHGPGNGAFSNPGHGVSICVGMHFVPLVPFDVLASPSLFPLCWFSAWPHSLTLPLSPALFHSSLPFPLLPCVALAAILSLVLTLLVCHLQLLQGGAFNKSSIFFCSIEVWWLRSYLCISNGWVASCLSKGWMPFNALGPHFFVNYYFFLHPHFKKAKQDHSTVGNPQFKSQPEPIQIHVVMDYEGVRKHGHHYYKYRIPVREYIGNLDCAVLCHDRRRQLGP